MGLRGLDGSPVIDAKRPIKLHVTKADITKADVKIPSSCAVARACTCELHATEVRVHLARVYVRTKEKGPWTRYITPRPMRDEIIAFDRGGTFEPGEFRLLVPQPTKKLGKRSGGPDKTKKSKSVKKRAKPTVITNVRTGPAT